MATKKRTSTANGTNGSRWIKKDARLAVYLRDRFTCLYCLRDLSDADPRDITLDHVKPGHGGDKDDPKNLCTACRTCNSRKRDLPLNRFAGPETRAHIARNCKRSMTKYLKLSRALIAGKTGFEESIPDEIS